MPVASVLSIAFSCPRMSHLFPSPVIHFFSFFFTFPSSIFIVLNFLKTIYWYRVPFHFPTHVPVFSNNTHVAPLATTRGSNGVARRFRRIYLPFSGPIGPVSVLSNSCPKLSFCLGRTPRSLVYLLIFVPISAILQSNLLLAKRSVQNQSVQC